MRTYVDRIPIVQYFSNKVIRLNARSLAHNTATRTTTICGFSWPSAKLTAQVVLGKPRKRPRESAQP